MVPPLRLEPARVRPQTLANQPKFIQWAIMLVPEQIPAKIVKSGWAGVVVRIAGVVVVVMVGVI